MSSGVGVVAAPRTIEPKIFARGRRAGCGSTPPVNARIALLGG